MNCFQCGNRIEMANSHCPRCLWFFHDEIAQTDPAYQLFSSLIERASLEGVTGKVELSPREKEVLKVGSYCRIDDLCCRLEYLDDPEQSLVLWRTAFTKSGVAVKCLPTVDCVAAIERVESLNVPALALPGEIRSEGDMELIDLIWEGVDDGVDDLIEQVDDLEDYVVVNSLITLLPEHWWVVYLAYNLQTFTYLGQWEAFRKVHRLEISETLYALQQIGSPNAFETVKSIGFNQVVLDEDWQRDYVVQESISDFVRSRFDLFCSGKI